MDTSSAETGSSQTMSWGSGASERDADPLPLPAGELVGEPPVVLLLQSDAAHQLLDALDNFRDE